ncbi:MAG: TlpA family protein disulfide reductase [Bacteroidia bacterium]|nr:TlpA family protein disulfide reductase [Bacteroidia bacterium]
MLKKLLFFTLFSFALGCLSAQANIQLKGSLTDCETDSLLFFQLNGNLIDVLGKIPLQGGDSIKSLNVSLNSNFPEGFYFIGGGRPQNSRLILFAGDPVIQIVGSCPVLSKAQVVSPNNQALEAATKQNESFGKEANQLYTSYRRARAQRKDLKSLDSMFMDLDNRKLNYFNQLRSAYPAVSKVLSLQTFPSFAGYGRKLINNEAIYLAGYYFQFVDFTDPFHDQNPHIQDAFRSYAQNLGQLGMAPKAQLKYVDMYLDQLRGIGVKGHKGALLGLIQGFQRSNEDMFIILADRYMAEYAKLNPVFTQSLQKQTAPIRSRMIGAIGPDIKLPNPEGDTLSLSDLRGNYVLVDFWASWCGPCRRENPNVRKAYAAYKDKGFEILGVSLDRSKDAWVKAIEKDQLEWLHVSDLKRFGSVAARAYGVHSIPATVLIDPEGRIIAKGLRGAALSKKLEEIYSGENSSKRRGSKTKKKL